MTQSTTGPTAPPSPADPETGVLYCANHPDVETLLRCNRCGKPICLKCARLTDVGYRCKECIRGVQAAYFTALPADNVIALVVALLVTAVATPIASFVLRIAGFWGIILSFMIGGAAGSMLAQIVRAAIAKRRGRYLPAFALAGIILGVIIGSFAGAIFLPLPLFNPFLLIFVFLAAASAYQFLR